MLRVDRLRFGVAAFLIALAAVAAVALAGGSSPALGQTARVAQTCTPGGKLGVLFVLDDSGSMQSSDPSALRARGVSVGLQQLPDGSVAGATRFSDDTQELFAPTTVDGTTRAGLSDAADRLDNDGGTDYEAAYRGALGQLPALAGATRRAVIFLSDGVPNDSDFANRQAFAEAGVPVYTVGLGSADAEVLTGLAAESGGQYFAATSTGAMQSIFARIVAILTCDAQNVSDSFPLAPGQTRDVPFTVGADDGEFRALAAWSAGQVDVTAVRADGSLMAPGSLRSGESLTGQETYALLTGSNPVTGAWALRLHANTGNVDDVDVTVDLWKRQLVQKVPAPVIAPATQPARPPVQGRHVDPCISRYPGGTQKSSKKFGGTKMKYDRELSLSLVCSGFGAPEGLVVTPAMQCALIAAAATYGGPVVSKGVDWGCTGGDIVEALETGQWTGAAASKACGYFSDVFAGGVGVVAAGATVETGPGAVAVGVNTYKALAAGLKVACGGLFAGGAKSVGVKFEADHETDIALDVTRRGKCIAYTETLGILNWSAEKC